MSTPDVDRGVSEVIGFVLVFSIIVISFSIYQGIVVPQQNQVVEINHNQRAQTDLINLRDSIIRSATIGVSQATTVTVGANYPRRTIAVNFGVTGGKVETRDPNPSGANEIVIENARAIDAETNDYFQQATNPFTFPTQSIVYSPTYTRYADAPDTVISAGTVFNDFQNTNLSLTGQIIVSGRTITLIAVEGDLSKAKFGEGASVTVETQPLSVASNRVSITNTTGNQIVLTIPTRIDEQSVWEDASLQGERTSEGGFITNIDDTGTNKIEITLQQDKRYTLQLAKVGVGTDTTEPSAAYLTDVTTPGGTVQESSSNLITLEVRDAFNNPANGFLVNASIESSAGGTGESLSVVGESESLPGNPAKTIGGKDYIDAVSTSDGRITFNYTAPEVDSGASATLNFTIYTFQSGKPEVYETVLVKTDVLNTGGDDPNDAAGSGAGSGGYTDFQDDKTEVVDENSGEGGVWDNVGSLEHIYLSELTIKDPFDGDTQEFKLKFEIIDKSSGDKYEFDIAFKYDWNSNSWKTNKVSLTGPNGQVFNNEALQSSELDSIYLPVDGTGQLDLVGNDDYQGNPWSSSELTDFKNFASSDTYIKFTQVQKGSIKLEVQ